MHMDNRDLEKNHGDNWALRETRMLKLYLAVDKHFAMNILKADKEQPRHLYDNHKSIYLFIRQTNFLLCLIYLYADIV